MRQEGRMTTINGENRVGGAPVKEMGIRKRNILREILGRLVEK